MPVNADPLELHMLSLINEERTSRGLDPLELETNLNMSAEDHSQWMLSTNNFSHTGAGGSSATSRIEAELDLTGSWRTAENIAIQSIRGEPGLLDDVENLHDSLMNSPGHRANILNPDLDYIGLGIELGEFTYSGGSTFQSLIATQNFATTTAPVDLDPGAGATPLEMPDPIPGPEPEPVPDIAAPETPPETPDEMEETPVAEAPDPAPEEPETTGNEDDEETPVETPIAEAPDPAPSEPEDIEDTPVAEVPDPMPDEPEEQETPVAEAPDPQPETLMPEEPENADNPEEIFACPFLPDDFDIMPARSTARFDFDGDVFEFRQSETLFGDFSMGDLINNVLTQAAEFAEQNGGEIDSFEFAVTFDFQPGETTPAASSGQVPFEAGDLDFAGFQAPAEQNIELFS